MSASRGRPRTFDPELVLDAATRVFWARGFEGTSVNDLVEATGLNKPSLYAAFGDKETLYNSVVERYAAGLEKHQRELLESEPDIWCALEALLRHSAVALTDPSLPGGCLVITGLADCGTPNLPPATERLLRDALGRTETAILDRLGRARQERQISAKMPIAPFAGALTTWMAGMAIRTKAGADRAALDASIDALVGLWPRG
ncbi:MAG: TetR/AcrR family transcriptional regulator [Fibrobacteria bacterium]|nr:TetR/AcrR family transcriptional regulator [Fibrobacteria bacterium]